MRDLKGNRRTRLKRWFSESWAGQKVRRLHRIDRRWKPLLAIFILVGSGLTFYHAFTVPCNCGITVGEAKEVSNPAGALIAPNGSMIPYPAVNWNLAVNFSAKGALSANNQISVTADVFNVVINATNQNLTRYFDKIGFTGSRLPGMTDDGEAYLPLKYIGKGIYQASGTLVWPESGPTWPYLHIRGPLYVATLESFESGTPLLTISSISNTLSLHTNETSLFLTWVLVGFSILMLQPILEAILIQEDGQSKSDQTQAQSEPALRAK